MNQRRGLGGAEMIAVIAIIIMVGIMAATWLGVDPRVIVGRLGEAPPVQVEQPRPQPQPVVAPAVVAPAPVQQSAPVVQSVPQGQAPQQVSVPAAPAPVESGAPVQEAPAPKPIVIVSHEGYQQPVITGSGACAVAAKGARRCGK